MEGIAKMGAGIFPCVICLVLALSSCFPVCGARCWEEEERALLAIKDSITHPSNYSVLPSWGVPGRNCCEWGGVFCGSSNLRVVSIELNDVVENGVTWYPEMGLFTRFPELQSLRLSHNQISGQIKAFCESRKLQYLDLRGNLLMGTIPPCLGTMNSLQYIDVSHNQLEGKVPASVFSNLTSLETLFIANNRFGGMLSFSIFANLSNLVNLDLSSNYQLEIETENPSWSPSFQLSMLYMANCKVSQQSSKGFPSFISTQNLEDLDMSNTSLSGSFSSLLNLLMANSTSSKGRYGNITRKLEALDMSHNSIHGLLPDSIGLQFPQMSYLYLSYNDLHGSIPSSFRGWHLSLSNNFFSGVIPPELTANGSALVHLMLSNNCLNGEMLPRDSNLNLLGTLLLNGNSFSGPFSSNLSNSPYLRQLSIQNNQLYGDVAPLFPVLPGLVSVLLGGNRFEGRIPSQLCQLKVLQYLDLSNNRFSENIPSCLSNITVLTTVNSTSIKFPYGWNTEVDFTTKWRSYAYVGQPLYLMAGFDMSHNLLTGFIPPEFGDLKYLHSLNLSYNLLTGPLPSSFGNLKSIESLDLSHNKLTGSIPHEVSQLDWLSAFSVAYNALSGKIPFDGQFSTFTADSYVGNPGLCGKPLEQNCSPGNTSSTHFILEEEEEHGLVDSDLFFYSIIAIGYALGLWGTIIFLVFNPKWRMKYLMTVDRLFGLCFRKSFER